MKLTKTQLDQYGGNILDAFSGAATGITGNKVETVWVSPEDTASTDVRNRTIYLPWQGDNIGKEQWLKLRGYCMHEEMHLLYTDPDEWESAVREGPEVTMVTNILEDARINTKGFSHHLYGSTFKVALDHTWRMIIKDVLMPAYDRGDNKKMDLKDQVLNAVHAEMSGLYALGLPDDMYHVKARKAAKLWCDKYRAELMKGSTKTAHELALKLATISEQEEDKHDPDQDGDDDVQGGGDGDSDGNGSGDGDAGDAQGDDAGDDQGGGGQSGGPMGQGDISDAWSNAAASKQDADAWKEFDGSDKSIAGRVHTMDVVGMDRNTPNNFNQYSEAYTEIRTSCNRAGALLRSALLEQARTAVLREQDEGEINEDYFTDIAMGRVVDAPFILHRAPKRDVNTAMCLIGDGSSSMQHISLNHLDVMSDMSLASQKMLFPDDERHHMGDKAWINDHMYHHMLMGADGVQNATLMGIHDMLRMARVTHEVSWFYGWGLEVIKPFAAKSIPEQVQQQFISRQGNGGTPIAEALKTAANRLLRRPEERKIVVVMSDGDADDHNEARAIVSVLRDLGVEVYGFGLGEDHISACFPDPDSSTVIAVEPSEIPDKLSELIRHITAKNG